MKTLRERLNGLSWRLTATRRLWSASAQPEMPFLPPAPKEGPSARGKIDEPKPNAALERGMVDVRGWSFFESGPTARVDLRLGDSSLGRARVGIPRPDVLDTIGQEWGAAAGFDVAVDIDDWPEDDGPALLHAVATSGSGERHELEPVPVEVIARRRHTPPIPPPPAETPLAPERPGRRLLVFTHQLDLGGAQLYLLELLGALLEAEAVNPTVVSGGDGEIRERLEALGIPVHIAGMLSIDDLSAHVGQLEELAAWAAGRDFEAALVNTATPFSFPGAELAERLGIPALWSIHESVKPKVMWAHMDPGVRRRAEQAMAGAALALFVAEPTQRLYEGAVPPERCLAVPYGFDFGPIEEARRTLDRGAERRRLGIPDEAEVVLCLGTVEPRKRQVPLAQAFDAVAAKHPNARLAIVGARDDEYAELLEHVAETGRAKGQIDVIPMTPDVQRWLCVSNLMVCASDIESLPRTVVEAMAWEMPVLATDVFGLPELIAEDETGWLCETRDVSALADGLDRALSSSPEERAAMGRRARELVLRRHSLPVYARQVATLLEGAIEPSRPIEELVASLKPDAVPERA
jgi:D-inositol-3-phosphate glycosyltransferase